MRTNSFLFVLVVVTIFFLGACSNSKDIEVKNTQKLSENMQMSYNDFLNIVENFKLNFQPKNFLSISNDEMYFVSSSFPKQHLDDSKNDLVDGEVGKSRRFEFYYKSKKNLLAKVNFIYFPSNHEQQYVTLQTIGHGPTNIEKGKVPKTFSDLPFITENLLAFDGFLVYINFLHLDSAKKKNVSDEKLIEMIESENDFYENFEGFILNTIK